MEYLQMTLDDWVTMKERLKQDLNGVAESFVRIGYTLPAIKEQKLYEQDDYENMETFAQCEYGLSPSTVSRFIAINKKYSLDGNSEQLRPEFVGIGSTKLAEMLTLPDADFELIRPETTRESIRELKEFNRTVPGEGETTELQQVIVQFYKDNPDILNGIYGAGIQNTADLEELVYLVNPSGNRTYRKGLIFLMLYSRQEGLKIKKHGQSPDSMSWEYFLAITKDIFDSSDKGKKTYEAYFGIPVAPEPPPVVEVTKAKAEKVAPAQENLGKPRRKPDFTPEQEASEDRQEEIGVELAAEVQLPGQVEIEDYPEALPEDDPQPEAKANNMEFPEAEKQIVDMPTTGGVERTMSILRKLLSVAHHITEEETDMLQMILTKAEAR